MKEKASKIIDNACEVWGVSKDEVLKDCRKQRLVLARATISYTIYHTLHLSLSDTGRLLNRSHASIIHHLDVYENEYKYNKEFRELANRIKEITLDIKNKLQQELEQEYVEIMGYGV